MDFLKVCLEKQDGSLIEKLKVAGFSPDQARQFLPEAASGFLDSTQDKGVEQVTQQLVSNDPARFLNSTEVDSITEKLGMNSELVKKGLAAIAPELAKVFA